MVGIVSSKHEETKTTAGGGWDKDANSSATTLTGLSSCGLQIILLQVWFESNHSNVAQHTCSIKKLYQPNHVLHFSHIFSAKNYYSIRKKKKKI